MDRKDSALKTKTAAQLRKLAKKHHVKQTRSDGKTKKKKQLITDLRKAGVK